MQMPLLLGSLQCQEALDSGEEALGRGDGKGGNKAVDAETSTSKTSHAKIVGRTPVNFTFSGMPATCGCSQAGDQTHAIAVTMPDPKPSRPLRNSSHLPFFLNESIFFFFFFFSF